MAENRVQSEDCEATEDDLAILPAVNAQGYMYEPRIQQCEVHSDDYSEEEGIGDSGDEEIPDQSERVGNTYWYAL